MSGVKTVLIVEDELKITRLVRDYLEQAGFAVVEAADGQAAIAAARAERPDMILLDLGLPGMDGLDVTRRLRETSSVPIIMLTARVEETDRIVGLELGADDYITKPFSPRELVARIRAVLRRADATLGGGALVRAGEVTLDIPKRRVTVRDGEVELTATEFDLLLTVARHPGRIYTRAQLLDNVHV
jgi:two-component system alkaline phosphatase synthesis response regulator PhoP